MGRRSRHKAGCWRIEAEPQVMRLLLRTFPRARAESTQVVRLADSEEVCRQLEWFMLRYPLRFKEEGRKVYLEQQARGHEAREARVRRLLAGEAVEGLPAGAVGGSRQLAMALMALPPRDYQQLAAEMAFTTQRMLLGDDLGTGKAQPLDSRVLTPSGWKRMGDLQVGEEVVDPDGGTGVVEAIFPQGEKAIYRISTSGNASTECCEAHLWLMRTAMGREHVVPMCLVRLMFPVGVALNLPRYDAGGLTWERIESISYAGRKLAQCIRVSTKRHLYVTDGGLVTHNTISTLTFLTRPEVRPAIIVAPKDLVPQWLSQAARFVPGLTTREAKTGNPEELTRPYRGKVRPLPDILLITYHKLKGWVPALINAGFRSIVFEEAHELRTGPDSDKWLAAKEVSEALPYALGLTATPVFNYGGQAYWILDAIKPGALGTPEEFSREWCRGASLSNKALVVDGRAFGSYLRREGLMLRRTVRELGLRLPKVTSNVHYVDSDLKYLAEAEDKAAELARIVLAQQGFSNQQKLLASGELDARLRKATGIAKAPFVADFVRMLVEAGEGRPEPVVLTGHHHEVYAIWEERLRDLNPVFWTGRETRAQKLEALRRFQAREAHVFILANRAGAGLDGLQHVCNTLVHGELDWAFGVMLQLRGRLDRDGQMAPVMVHTPISNAGCDPIMADVLGLKAMQLESINNPGEGEIREVQTDPEHIKRVAQAILERRGKLAEVA